MNTEVLSIKFSSDHRMLRLSYRANLNKKSRSNYGHNNKNYTPIEIESLKNLMSLHIHQTVRESINDAYQATISTIKECVTKLPSTAKEKTHK